MWIVDLLILLFFSKWTCGPEPLWTLLKSASVSYQKGKKGRENSDIKHLHYPS